MKWSAGVADAVPCDGSLQLVRPWHELAIAVGNLGTKPSQIEMALYALQHVIVGDEVAK
jgi:hypothetical protein